MKKIKLKIKKLECKDKCPIPLNLIPNIEKGIKKIDYNEQSGIGKISFNEKLLTEKQVIEKIKKIGYEVEE